MSLPRTYDALFERYGSPDLPVEFLRALAWGESRMNPRDRVDAAKPNSATGLLQVVGVVRADYNQRHGTAFTPDDLFDPDVNVRLATETLRHVLTTYRRHRTLRPDWLSKRWVELVVYGWNAGYSDGAGVGYVVGEIESAAPIALELVTIEQVKATAAWLPRASKYLQRRLNWHKRVARNYFDELGLPASPVNTGGQALGLALLVALKLGGLF